MANPKQSCICVIGIENSGKATLVEHLCPRRGTFLLDDGLLPKKRQINNERVDGATCGCLSELLIHDLLFSICEFLPVRDLVRLSQVSQDMMSLCSSELLWEKLFRTYYGVATTSYPDRTQQVLQEKYNGSWKNYFLHKIMHPMFRSMDPIGDREYVIVKPSIDPWKSQLEVQEELQAAMSICSVSLVVLSADYSEKDVQTLKTQLVTLFTIGVKNTIVVISKVDTIPRENRIGRIVETCRIIQDLLRRVGYAERNISIVPVSARENLGIAEPYSNWISTCKKSLMEALRTNWIVSYPFAREMYAEIVRNMGASTYLYQGKNIQASVAIICILSNMLLHSDQQVRITNLKKGTVQYARVRGIFSNVASAETSDSTSLKSTEGYMIVQAIFADDNNNRLNLSPNDIVTYDKGEKLLAPKQILCQLIVLTNQIEEGKYYHLKVRSHSSLVRISHVQALIDKRTGRENTSSSQVGGIPVIRMGEAAIVLCEILSPLFCTAFRDFSPFGRFILSYLDDVTGTPELFAVGIIKSIESYCEDH